MDPAAVARRSLARHGDVRTESTPIEYTATPFETTIEISEDTTQLTILLPTLRAVVQGETVGDAVADGWFETLSRRLADAPKATSLSATTIELSIDREPSVVRVQYWVSHQAPAQLAETITALVQFTEGTYLQGAIPGYEYDDPIASMLSQASEQAGSDGVDPTHGGTPL